MNNIRGYYINLESSTKRREEMECQIKNLGYMNTYERYNAKTSTNDEANDRGLSKSELGLWKSWQGILETEIKKYGNQEYGYLHILEDDAIINREIWKLTQKLKKHKHNYLDIHILFTEMYVNAQFWLELKEKTEKLKKDGAIIINKKYYTGCASSALIPRERIRYVHDILQSKLNGSEPLLPLDNMFRRLKEDDILNIGCTLPFLSCVRETEIRQSTIQDRDKIRNAIDSTQEINALLRRSLSIMNNKNTDEEISQKIIELATVRGGRNMSEMLREMLKYANNKQLFRYKYDERLLNEADNGQEFMKTE